MLDLHWMTLDLIFNLLEVDLTFNLISLLVKSYDGTRPRGRRFHTVSCQK